MCCLLRDEGIHIFLRTNTLERIHASIFLAITEVKKMVRKTVKVTSLQKKNTVVQYQYCRHHIKSFRKCLKWPNVDPFRVIQPIDISQSEFRKHHSTISLLIRLTDNVRRAVNRKHPAILAVPGCRNFLIGSSFEVHNVILYLVYCLLIFILEFLSDQFLGHCCLCSLLMIECHLCMMMTFNYLARSMHTHVRWGCWLHL